MQEHSYSYTVNNMIKAAIKGSRSIMRDFIEISNMSIFGSNSIKKFVSKSEEKVENAIIQYLKSFKPDYNILSEGQGEIILNENAKYRWIIDPIDGSSNFAHGNNNYAISLALQEIKSENNNTTHRSKLSINSENLKIRKIPDCLKNIVAGVIYIPMTNEIYWAEKKAGAYYIDPSGEEKKLTINKDIATIQDLMISTVVYHQQSEEYKNLYNLFAKNEAKIRVSGSIAIDSTQFTRNMIDAALYNVVRIWDIAAAYILIEEAGGEMYFLGKKRDVNNINAITDVLMCSEKLFHKTDNLLKR